MSTSTTNTFSTASSSPTSRRLRPLLIPADAVKFILIAGGLLLAFTLSTMACCIAYKLRKRMMRRLAWASVNEGLFDYSDASGWIVQPRRQTASTRAAQLKKMVVKPKMFELWEEKPIAVPQVDSCGHVDGGLALESVQQQKEAEFLFPLDRPLGAQMRGYWHHIMPISARVHVETYDRMCPELYALPLDVQLAYLYKAKTELRGRAWKRRTRKGGTKDQAQDTNSPKVESHPPPIHIDGKLQVAVFIAMPAPRPSSPSSYRHADDSESSEVLLGTTSIPWEPSFEMEDEDDDEVDDTRREGFRMRFPPL